MGLQNLKYSYYGYDVLRAIDDLKDVPSRIRKLLRFMFGGQAEGDCAKHFWTGETMTLAFTTDQKGNSNRLEHRRPVTLTLAFTSESGAMKLVVEGVEPKSGSPWSVVPLQSEQSQSITLGLKTHHQNIADLLKQGKSNAEIAALLGYQYQSIKNDVSEILRQLNCATRVEAALRLNDIWITSLVYRDPRFNDELWGVARPLAKGMKYKDIAKALDITESKVKKLANEILKMLGCSTRLEAALVLHQKLRVGSRPTA